MAFVTVARVEDVPPGTVKHMRAGKEEIAVANVNDEFFVTQGHCLHLKGPLGHGELDGPVLSCPWHGWQYDMRTGLNEFDHAIQLRCYEVRVEDGEIQVAI